MTTMLVLKRIHRRNKPYACLLEMFTTITINRNLCGSGLKKWNTHVIHSKLARVRPIILQEGVVKSNQLTNQIHRKQIRGLADGQWVTMASAT